ncbi:MAG: hypothetical protein ABI035_08135 [Gemmatimonadaceae bacterium]
MEQQTMRRLAIYASAHRMRFVRIGASVDKSATAGRTYLESLGAFDAISVGGGWLNPVAVTYMMRDNAANPTLPQIVVITRKIDLDSGSPIVSPDTLLGRLIGMEGMLQWLRQNP